MYNHENYRKQSPIIYINETAVNSLLMIADLTICSKETTNTKKDKKKKITLKQIIVHFYFISP